MKTAHSGSSLRDYSYSPSLFGFDFGHIPLILQETVRWGIGIGREGGKEGS